MVQEARHCQTQHLCESASSSQGRTSLALMQLAETARHRPHWMPPQACDSIERDENETVPLSSVLGWTDASLSQFAMGDTFCVGPRGMHVSLWPRAERVSLPDRCFGSALAPARLRRYSRLSIPAHRRSAHQASVRAPTRISVHGPACVEQMPQQNFWNGVRARPLVRHSANHATHQARADGTSGGEAS